MSPHTATKSVIEVLGRVSLFQSLPRSDLEAIAGLARPRDIGAREFLFREGDPGDRLYLLLDGAVEVLKERPLGDHERLAVHRGGEAVGEMSLLDGAPRGTSVRAVEDTHLLVISRDDFEALLGGDSIAARLLHSLARSVRAIDVRLDTRDAGGADGGFRQFGRVVLGGLEPATAPRAEGYRIAGATARDEATGGGSLWDGFTTEDGRTLLALLDVKGGGLPPAYLIAITRALLHEIAPDVPFDTLLARLNSATFHNLFDGLDECVEAALVELTDGRLRWACAGDQAGFIIRADGTVEAAPSQGPPLGILPQFDYQTLDIELATDELLIAVSEAPAGLVKGAIDLVKGRADAEPAEIAALLQAALRKIQARGAETDVAFVVVKKT